MKPYFWIISLSLFVVLTGCSLAGDVTPPPNASLPTVTSAPVTVADTYPLVAPDLISGQAIYAEKCAPCHGETGMGDGSLAEKSPSPVPAIGDLAVARKARPADWYTLVTVGKMTNGMPGFKSLNDRQRWDVVAYALTLSVTPEQMAAGQQVYEDFCATCHGNSGAGDGPDSAGKNLPDWRKPETLAIRSDAELATVIASGKDMMPAYASQLDEAQIWAVSAYLRTLLTPSSGMAENLPANPPEVNPAVPQTITIKGQVEMVSGGMPPADLPVTLQGYDEMTMAVELAGKTQSDGTFSFVDAPFKEGRVYIAVLEYQGASFTSNPLHSVDVISGVIPELVITIYGTTTDTAALSAERLHVIFDFSDPAAVNVAEIFLLTNSGEQIIVGEAGQPVLTYRLPNGASDVQFPDDVDGTRFVLLEDGFGDLAAIAPGAGHQVVVVYTLPVQTKLNLKFETPVAVSSTVVMVAAGGEAQVVKSDQLQSGGERTVQGTSVELYTGGALSAGESLDLTIGKKQPFPTLPIGLAALGAALILGGFMIVRQKNKAGQVEEAETFVESKEALLDAIIALDDQFAAGKIPEDLYRERREDLKTKLAQMKAEEN